MFVAADFLPLFTPYLWSFVHTRVWRIAQLNLDDSWVKRRLTKTGLVMLQGEGIKEIANESDEESDAPKQKLPADYCGDCYGAGDTPTSCCNTCVELISSYTRKGWSTKEVSVTSEQCKREGLQGTTLEHLTIQGEGCNLSGSMLVNKVAGNFHIAMGNAVVKDGRHIHQFLPADAPNFNSTHIIHELSFGPPVPGVESPLDGRVRVATAVSHAHSANKPAHAVWTRRSLLLTPTVP